jgi:hypothetical protein
MPICAGQGDRDDSGKVECPNQRALQPHGEGGDAQQYHLRIWTLGKIPDERPEEREGEQDEPFDSR